MVLDNLRRAEVGRMQNVSRAGGAFATLALGTCATGPLWTRQSVAQGHWGTGTLTACGLKSPGALGAWALEPGPEPKMSLEILDPATPEPKMSGDILGPATPETKMSLDILRPIPKNLCAS